MLQIAAVNEGLQHCLGDRYVILPGHYSRLGQRFLYVKTKMWVHRDCSPKEGETCDGGEDANGRRIASAKQTTTNRLNVYEVSALVSTVEMEDLSTDKVYEVPKGVSSKLFTHWKGPYQIMEQTGPLNYKIRGYPPYTRVQGMAQTTRTPAQGVRKGHTVYHKLCFVFTKRYWTLYTPTRSHNAHAAHSHKILRGGKLSPLCLLCTIRTEDKHTVECKGAHIQQLHTPAFDWR
eukprot:g81693.t1